MGKIVIRDGIKWDYDAFWNRYTFIEKVEEKPKEEKPKENKSKKTKKVEDE